MAFATSQDRLDVQTDAWLCATNDDGLPGLSSFSFRAALSDTASTEGERRDLSDDRLRHLTASEAELLLWIADGWTASEIADVLGIKYEAAKKRISRARQRIQQRGLRRLEAAGERH